MAKRIVKKDFSIAGMEPSSMFKQYLLYRRMPFINIVEGPRLKYLFELFCMHNLGRTMVNLEVDHPGRYQFLMRIRNSLVFRYNHYRRNIARTIKKNISNG